MDTPVFWCDRIQQIWGVAIITPLSTNDSRGLGLETLHETLEDRVFTSNVFWLVVEPTHLKNMLVKLGIFPGDKKKLETTT